MNVSFYEGQLEREVSVQLYVLWREISEREEKKKKRMREERDTIIVLNVEVELHPLNEREVMVCDES